MTIAERNAIRHPEELSNTIKNDRAIREWAASTTRTVATEHVEYQLPCERGIWDVRNETGSLLPSDASYTCLLEPR